MKKGKRYALKAISVLIITMATFIPEIELLRDNKWIDVSLRVVIVTVLVVLSELITNRIIERYDPFGDIIQFLNYCLKKEVDIVSVLNNTEASSENDLSTGDEIHILTNDLMNYDLHKPALSLIAKRIIAGAKYYYYIPHSIMDDYNSFMKRLESEIRSQLPQKNTRKIKQSLNEGVSFFFVQDEDSLSYNFSITLFDDHRKDTGCWYINEKDITIKVTQTDVPELLIVRMKSYDDVKELKEIFVKLVKRYELKIPESSKLFQ